MHLDLWKPVLVLGTLEAGLYALLPIALVLSYRVSRTIAFVHGGIAAAAAFIYWELSYNEGLVPGHHPAWPPALALIVVLLVGAMAGGAYGGVVTSPKVVTRSRMTLTVMSLSAMLLIYGICTGYLNVPQFVYPPSPFGRGGFSFGDVRVTNLRLATLCAAAVLVLALVLFLELTRTGRHLRAIADDLQGAQWSGVDVTGIGCGVYAFSGAISALAGVLIAATVGADPGALLQFLLRGLAVAVIGGMVSLPLALAGAVTVSVMQTALTSGMFGTVSLSLQELSIDLVLVAGVVAVTRVRGTEFYLLTRQSL